MPRSICVFCSSSDDLDPEYQRAAVDLGELLAARGDTLVYGGGSIGTMGLLSRSARRRGGRVVGVIPALLRDRELADHECDELLVTTDLRDRKTIMESRAEGFLVLPGGFGTIEEMFEIAALRVLGFHEKPIVLINTKGFYDPLVDQLERLFRDRMARPRHREIVEVATTPEEALERIDEILNRPSKEG